MASSRLRMFASLLWAVALIVAAPAGAQSVDPKAAEQSRQPADAAKDGQKQLDEFAEAARLQPGPAGSPECVWLGRRVVSLLSRDDLDTAFRHLDLYDRFGCPAGHIQATFRCVIKAGTELKASETLVASVHKCWINPGSQPNAAVAAPGQPATTNR